MSSIFNDIEKYGDGVALISENNEAISYCDLVDVAAKIAEIVEQRSLVFLVSRNCKESVAGYVGFLRKKVVPFMVNENLGDELFESLMETYRPKYLYAPINKIDKQRLSKVVYTYGDYALVRTEYEIDYIIHEDLALLLTTSGSTGSPKLVRLTYRNIEANTESIVAYLAMVKEDRAITNMPMSYTYGLSIITTHLYCGASVVLTEATLMDKVFWSLLKEQQVSTIGGVPYIYEILMKLRFAKMDLPSIRYITQAGGKLSKELAEEFSEVCTQKNIKMVVMYGQTEASPRMAYLPWEYAITKAGSMGIAIPGGKFWLEDVNGRQIEDCDTVGELVYQGDNVTHGYAESRYDLCKGDENQGVLHTGDMAKRDSDRFYYIVGRKKRFLKLFGSRVNLDEVEGLLKKEGIECACTGKDDQLIIYITDANKIKRTRDFTVEHININRAGFKISVIDIIPRSEAGKVLYLELGDNE